jgi:hypothetical protein
MHKKADTMKIIEGDKFPAFRIDPDASKAAEKVATCQCDDCPCKTEAVPEVCVDDYKSKDGLLRGEGVSSLFKDIIPLIEKAFDMSHLPRLSEDMFDHGDDVVKEVREVASRCSDDEPMIPRVLRVLKIHTPNDTHILASFAYRLHNVRRASRARSLRFAYSEISSFKEGSGARSQANAARIVERLLLDTRDESERNALTKTYDALLTGDKGAVDAAAYRVHSVYSSYIPKNKNTRLAFTYLETQAGEGFQMCPKAKQQLGYAVPMELSKCRDKCIDHKISSEGRVTCAYAQWLKYSADTHEKAMARLDVQRHPDNEANALELKAGERSKPDTKEMRNLEQRMYEADLHIDASGLPSLEDRLNDASPAELGHHGEAKKRINDADPKESKQVDKTREESLDKRRKNSEGEETLEALMDELHEELTEEELDRLLDEWLEGSRSKDN